jgi:hypothetical protein
MKHAVLFAALGLVIGVALGVVSERWHAGTLARSDVACAAARQELARLEEMLARQPRASSNPDFMALIERNQATIARNCGWLPPSAMLPPPKPTEPPKPSTAPANVAARPATPPQP